MYIYTHTHIYVCIYIIYTYIHIQLILIHGFHICNLVYSLKFVTPKSILLTFSHIFRDIHRAPKKFESSNMFAPN